ncbi:MAG TPA: SDR family NAD(P)-dependent oxidoreductase, partial [Trueperaceae bacterium]|nr:SDR family NAD(P)-dependent oxidoreductase [Trueperaceae bacterium]
ADIEAQLRLNALAPLLVARAASPGMRARGRGRIIAVGSTNGLLVTPFMGAYSAGKFALEAFSDALRLELLPFGVEVVLIQPGAMKTGFAAAAKRGLEEEAERVGEPWAEYLLRLRDSNLWGEKTAADPRAVARAITKAALRPRSRARLAGTRDVPLLKLFAALPDAVKDRAFIRPLRLRRAPKRER